MLSTYKGSAGRSTFQWYVEVYDGITVFVSAPQIHKAQHTPAEVFPPRRRGFPAENQLARPPHTANRGVI
eukprot:scaffold305026_cov17-Prasinocladus_malaysianus.AAC.1